MVTREDWESLWQAADHEDLRRSLRWGPGHIVFDDQNMWDGSIAFCLELAAQALADGVYLGEVVLGEDRRMIEVAAVLLRWLRLVPEDVRVGWYDG